MRASVLVLLTACSGKSPESAPTDRGSATRVEAPVGTVPRAAPTPPGPYQIHWSNMEAVDNCFFFSGPDGRDDQLVGEVRVETVELEDSALRIRIGTTVFEGTYVSGTIDLVRDSTHEFGGTWKTHETLRGRLVDDELRATYHYEECEVATGDCPGRCTITADVTLRR